MILAIAEKPSLAKDIASALPGTAKLVDKSYYEVGDYTVTWLYGHVLTLKDPEDYDSKYADRSNMDLLPIYFENWETKISESKDNVKKQRVVLIGKLLKKASCVVHAGDPDDEGQLLVDEVLRWHKYTGPVKRLDTGNTTKEALQKALKRMKDNAPSEKEGWAAYARSVADFIVGINLTRYFSALNKMHLPFGRVKIPTLGLVVARDEQIENHKETVYYEIEGTTTANKKKIGLKYIPLKTDENLTDGRILSRTYAETKQKMMDGYHGPFSVKKSGITAAPPLPFNLVKLQSYCSAQFGYSPSQTLEITQSLRTVHHAITYNRSDCQYLSEEHYKEAPKTIAATLDSLGIKVPGINPAIKSKCFNDANITAHFAIIPSGQRVDISKLSAAEKNVYTAICKYYLIQFMPPAKKEKTILVMPLPDKATAEASSISVLVPGYLDLLKGEKEDTKESHTDLSSVPEGNYTGTITDVVIREAKTKPPARYTKASLNEDMTRIAKYVDNPEVKKLLLEKDKDKKGENGSIGTSATRSSIIDDLIKLEYIREDGKKLISTKKGRDYFHILPDEFKKADMTAYWWVMQEDIKAGKITPSDLAKSVLESVRVVLGTSYPTLDKGSISGDVSKIGVCPICNSSVIETKSAFSCSGHKDGCTFAIWKKPIGSIFKKITITASQAKSLLSGKDINVSHLYSEKKDSEFSGKIHMDIDPTFKYKAKLSVLFEQDSVGVCPICGGEIIEFGKGYKCSNPGGACKFIVWKTGVPGSLFAKTKLTRTQMSKLLNNEKINVTLYSKTKDKTFSGSAVLTMHTDTNTVSLDPVFEDTADEIGICPRCGGRIIETPLAFACEDNKNGCRFVIWKKAKSGLLSKTTITKSMAKTLLSGKKATVKTLYSSKKDSTFTGKIYLEDNDAVYGPDIKMEFL